jgi:transposase InsO family protein
MNGQGQLRATLNIRERPAEADDRAVPGHWEGDLLMGKRMHAMATLVERKSRFVMLVALPNGHSADVVADALATKITELPDQLRRSLTWDQGKEMAAHARKYNIVPEFSFILGNPPDSRADVLRGIEFIRKVKAVNPHVEIIMYRYDPVPLAGEMWQGALDSARDTLRAELEVYIDQGHESASWGVRAQLAEVELRAGRAEVASVHALDAYEIVVEAGWVDVLSHVASVRSAIEVATGKVEEARTNAATALSICDRTGDRWNEIRARCALGFLELSLGHVAAAHDCLAPAVQMTERMDMREPGVFPFVPDEVEAIVALGELDAAERLTDRLDEQGKTLDRPVALATAVLAPAICTHCPLALPTIV